MFKRNIKIVFYLLCSFIPICFFLVVLCFTFNNWYQKGTLILIAIIPFLLFLLSSLISIILAITKRKEFKKMALLPFILIPSSIFLVIYSISKLNLNEQLITKRLDYDLPKFNQIIAQIQSDTTFSQIGNYEIKLPPDFPAIRAGARRYNQNELMVTFNTGGGGPPPVDWGYIYSSDDNIEEVNRGFSYSKPRKIRPHWYRFAD